MAAMRHAERSMQASLEAATNHATSLQHRLAQVIAQSSQLHQVLFNTQQCLEGTQTEKNALIKKLQETEETTKKTHTAQSQVRYSYCYIPLLFPKSLCPFTNLPFFSSIRKSVG